MQNDNLQICKIQKMGNPFPEKIQRRLFWPLVLIRIISVKSHSL